MGRGGEMFRSTDHVGFDGPTQIGARADCRCSAGSRSGRRLPGHHELDLHLNQHARARAVALETVRAIPGNFDRNQPANQRRLARKN